MSERALALDEATMKAGLLMESAQVHQKLAESQLEKLRAHTADLDGVVRDEIRRTLIDELQMLTAETARATRTLERIRRAATFRGAFISLGAAAVFALAPVAIARWALPSPEDIALLRVRRDELTAQVAKLKGLGGRIDWRRCGDAPRLCVRVDRKAPTYGERGDYYVIEGY